jgi:hypothetical protein
LRGDPPVDSNAIDLTLREIGKSYAPGALRWTKKTKSRDWTRLLIEEAAINKAALEVDMTGLKEALSRYQRLIVGLSKKFKEEVGHEIRARH